MCQVVAQQAHLSALRDFLHADIAHLRRRRRGWDDRLHEGISSCSYTQDDVNRAFCGLRRESTQPSLDHLQCTCRGRLQCTFRGRLRRREQFRLQPHCDVPEHDGQVMLQ